ncbi:MAG: glycine--tRNA ligase subunit beta, partial [Gammaproteobacteria bacterium]|nr:glycine--tRNA ligase subunit beta [Gammaproteobacteria bacterium]
RALESSFAEHLRSGLDAAGLGFAMLRSFATPRRLAVGITALDCGQPRQRIEKRGPPLSVAFDAGGKPSRATTAFADSCGVPVEALGRIETPKGAWLHYSAEVPGQPATELLPGLVNAALAALPIPRRMRWGDGETEFVRPAHWVVMLLGTEVVPGTILGLTPARHTRGHRFHAPGPIELESAADYAGVLAENKVIADFAARRERVRQLADAAATSVGGQAIIDAELLDEVTALVEWPVALTGRFDAGFLRLPEEVLIAVLQGHQRYFPVRNSDGRLLPHFIATANLESRDPSQIRQGNERVILPRLSDAAFFWDQDLKTSLESRLERLDSVVFQKGLGSLRERSVRVARLASRIAEKLGSPTARAERAALLAKADLLTQMVGEFPELQGRMGYHYARLDGEAAEVAVAIEEQYLPRHAGDRLPGSADGRALSVADRADTLAGVFALGKRPSGAKDPFGLRRTALGLLRILVEDQLDLDLPALLDDAVRLQPLKVADPAALASELFGFIMDRARAWYLDGQAPELAAGAITAEMFEAVRSRRSGSLVDFHARLLGVFAFMHLPEAESLAVANKRIANILRSATGEPGAVNPALFGCREESALNEAVEHTATAHGRHLERRDYKQALCALAALRAPVDDYFNAVMVMAEDKAVRNNRLAQLRRLQQLFLDVADLSCLTGAANG